MEEPGFEPGQPSSGVHSPWQGESIPFDLRDASCCLLWFPLASGSAPPSYHTLLPGVAEPCPVLVSARVHFKTTFSDFFSVVNTGAQGSPTLGIHLFTEQCFHSATSQLLGQSLACTFSDMQEERDPGVPKCPGTHVKPQKDILDSLGFLCEKLPAVSQLSLKEFSPSEFCLFQVFLMYPKVGYELRITE